MNHLSLAQQKLCFAYLLLIFYANKKWKYVNQASIPFQLQIVYNMLEADPELDTPFIVDMGVDNVKGAFLAYVENILSAFADISTQLRRDYQKTSFVENCLYAYLTNARAPRSYMERITHIKKHYKFAESTGTSHGMALPAKAKRRLPPVVARATVMNAPSRVRSTQNGVSN
jgi:hypothetical protein